jgi:hypothetical protein
MNRRTFLGGTTAAAAAQIQAQSGYTPFTGSVPFDQKMIGIQAGAVSFVDEGVDKVLDAFQQRAAINTIFLAVFTYGRGIAGRQVPGQPLPDHGKQEYDLNFRGGNYATVHPQYYKNTVLTDTRARDHGDLDILATVLPNAKKRGMKTICWLEDVWRNDVPNIEKVQEIDLYGRRRNTLCLNHPDHRNFLNGLVEDYARSYDVDGIMWGSERHGALGTALGSSHGGRNSDPSRVGCFCEHCLRKAREAGVNADRAKEGYRQLEQFVKTSKGGKHPVDGHYVTFWRILMRYPEILAWEHMFHSSLREVYGGIYKTVKSAKATLPVGWHIWHTNSFSPWYRAEQDLQELAPVSDFLKIVIYHNCGGERMASYIDSITGSVYGDLPKDEALTFHYRVMNYQERSYAQIPFTGLSSDYVFRETKRAMAGAAGTKTLIWPGIDIDIPTELNHSRSTRQGTRAAVLAALKAGAHGVLLSRKYSEMMLANLTGAGDAIREFGLGL